MTSTTTANHGETPHLDPSFDRWLAKSPEDRVRWGDELSDTELKEMAALTRHIFHLSVGALQLARALTALLRFTATISAELEAQRMNGDAIMQARLDIGNATGIEGTFFDDVVNRLLDRLDRAETENARLRLQQNAHGARVTELLVANNREVERRRSAEARTRDLEEDLRLNSIRFYTPADVRRVMGDDVPRSASGYNDISWIKRLRGRCGCTLKEAKHAHDLLTSFVATPERDALRMIGLQYGPTMTLEGCITVAQDALAAVGLFDGKGDTSC